MKIRHLLLASFLSSLSIAANALEQLPTHAGGRVLEIKNETGELAYEYSWPSVYFETTFKGDSLMLKFDDDQNNFQLIVDGAEPIVIKKPGKQDYLVSNLQPGKHQVRLEKISETQSSSGRFLGFYSDDKPLSLRKRKSQIEFNVDS